MVRAIQYTGANSQDVCRMVTGLSLRPYELDGGFWLRQRDGVITLAMPAHSGEVYLEPGDWAVEDRAGWVRLSSAQMSVEHPEHDT